MTTTSKLPNGWCVVALEDLFQSITDGDHQPPPQADDGVPFLVIGDVRSGRLLFDDVRFVPPAYYASLAQQRKPRRGDLLYTVTGSFGIPVLVDTDEEFCVQRHIAILKPALRTNVRYVLGALATAAAFKQATEMATGTAQKTIGLKRLRKLTLPLAPENEQAGIVEAIESYLSRLVASDTTLERVWAKLKKYRASVLKAAVGGRLVPTEAQVARKENRAYEPAQALLDRILKKRREGWEKVELARLKKAGKAPKDGRWKTKYKEPAPPKVSHLPALPEGWCWASVEQLSSDVFYGSSAKAFETGDVPVIRMGNIVDGTLDLTDLKFLPRNHREFPDLLLRPGDMLFNRTNSAELVGKSAVYTGTPEPCSFASYLICVRAIEPIESQWIAHTINSPYGRFWVSSVVSQQVGQANVNGTKLKAFAVPLPPIAEQRRMLSVIDVLLSNAEHTAYSVAKERIRLARLRQAILKWAFEGKVVDQDPTDEPAQKLVDRIRAARAVSAPTEKTRGRRAKAA